MKHTTLNALALATALSLGLLSQAQAQSAGTISARAGATRITPKVDSGDLSAPSLAHSTVSVNANTQLGGGLTYSFTDHWVVDLPLATPFTHSLYGDGAMNKVGKLGEVKSLPATVLLQYRFLDANAPWRPYVGIGPTYAYFYDTHTTAVLSAVTGGGPGNPTTLKVESRWGSSIQLGSQFVLSGKWFADFQVHKTFISTRNTLSSGQTLDIKLDPVTVAVAVGYRF